MPSVKIPKKSTENDMTPFVDIAFLILSFFIMATKMKPPAPVEITTPNSVSTETLPENDALLVEMDPNGRVFFTMLAENKPDAKRKIIENMNTTRNLGLSPAEIERFVRLQSVGAPIGQMKAVLSQSDPNENLGSLPGIPVRDSANNELYYWVRDAVSAFAGSKLQYLIKADNNAKYTDFKRVLEAFKRNEIFKFQLVTTPEDAPIGTDLFRTRQRSGGTE